jgi:hypothetical protein
MKRGRGRPKKVDIMTRITPPHNKGGRVRPRKLTREIQDEEEEPRLTSSTYQRLLQYSKVDITFCEFIGIY